MAFKSFIFTALIVAISTFSVHSSTLSEKDIFAVGVEENDIVKLKAPLANSEVEFKNGEVIEMEKLHSDSEDKIFVPFDASEQTLRLTVGSRQPGDRQTIQENVNESKSYLGKKVIKEIKYTVPGGGIITQVDAINVKTDGTGASVVVIGGGPGQDNVTLRFKSQRWHGIHFMVFVYSK